MKDKDIPNLIAPLPEQSQELEDNLPMVTYIMLHRIYDLLTIIANKIVSPEDVSKDRKSTRLNSSHVKRSRMPSSA